MSAIFDVPTGGRTFLIPADESAGAGDVAGSKVLHVGAVRGYFEFELVQVAIPRGGRTKGADGGIASCASVVLESGDVLLP